MAEGPTVPTQLASIASPTARAPDRSPRAIPAWADSLTRVLDDAVRIPGTNIGIGLDAILGLILPGLGDAATGIASLGLLAVALRSGLPRIVLVRMVMNLGLDALIGAVPLVGDVFDVAFRANRKNLELIKRHTGTHSSKPTTGDYALVVAGVLAVLLAIALPIIMVTFLTTGLFHKLGW